MSRSSNRRSTAFTSTSTSTSSVSRGESTWTTWSSCRWVMYSFFVSCLSCSACAVQVRATPARVDGTGARVLLLSCWRRRRSSRHDSFCLDVFSVVRGILGLVLAVKHQVAYRVVVILFASCAEARRDRRYPIQIFPSKWAVNIVGCAWEGPHIVRCPKWGKGVGWGGGASSQLADNWILWICTWVCTVAVRGKGPRK